MAIFYKSSSSLEYTPETSNEDFLGELCHIISIAHHFFIHKIHRVMPLGPAMVLSIVMAMGAREKLMSQ